ncbi:hypothetical protein VTK56DRAFT_6956 [Thermocarpiscus australiensis]
MAAGNPRIRVRQATPADAQAIVDINFRAFDDNVMSGLLHPGGVSEDAKAKFASRLFPKPSDVENNAEGVAKKEESLVIVAEYLPEDGAADGPGEVIAFAGWALHREQLPEEEWNKDFTPTSELYGDGCDINVAAAFFGAMSRKQRAHAKGEPALYLRIIACKPGRQRLGAGSALVKWGVGLADSLGLPCRLEATPVGYGLYRKFGYEDVDVVDIKVTETWGVVNTNGSNWGANNAVALAGPPPEGVMRFVIMRRPAKKATA